jgi:catechol 2,3-dioxygenase-like lactoylglutathione lyase family enzyme
MPIGRLHHVIIDCPDPAASATFWSRLLGDPITYQDDDFVVVSTSSQASGLAFQRAPDQRPATWPDPAVPQQIHLDVMVDDVPESYELVLVLGATKLDGGDVFADPAGHPFCLIKRPTWAPAVAAGNRTERD